MGTTRKQLTGALLASAAIIAGAGSTAAAQENQAGEVVENVFTLEYSVGGAAQPAITNGATFTSNGTTYTTNNDGATTFTVDRKVDVNVTSVSGSTGIAPGQTDVPLIYSVDNEGNDNFQFLLTATNRTTNNNGTGANRDNFDAAPLEVRWYAAAAGTTCATDAASYTQNSATTTDIAAGERVCVRVLGDVPTTATDNDQAGVYLKAEARNPTAWAVSGGQAGTPGTAGDPLTRDDGTNANTVNGAAQNVFLDADGPADGATDAAHSDQGFIVVSSQPLSASKAVFATATDGTTCAVPTTLPTTQAGAAYFVPGACVVYVIEADNTGGSDATGITIADRLPEGVSYAASGALGDFTGQTVSAGASCTTPPASGNVDCDVTLSGGALASGKKGQLLIAARVD